MQPINGVDGYSTFILRLYMPKGLESCQYCPCERYDRHTDTYRCMWSWELLDNPKKERGENCPLEVVK